MLNTHNLTPYLGAEITGPDLSRPIDPAVTQQILHVLDERGVVIIRDQHLSLENFMSFSRALGPLDVHPLRKFSRPGFPELMINSNIVEDGQPIGLADAGQRWHTDGAYLETPYRATVLYGVEVPVKDGRPLGDTMFTSTSAAYDALDPEFRQRLSGMRAVNNHGVARTKLSMSLKLDESLKDRIQKGVEHPVIRTHPHTKRKCLYINQGTTQHICGLPQTESDALLENLCAHLVRSDFIYRHQWRAGDIVMWDNCSTQHNAVGDYELPQRRLLYRTLVKGSPVH